MPERLRGEMAHFDIAGKDGKVIVAKDKRITARHVRELVDGGVKHIAVPTEYVLGRTLATNVVDTSTGEVIAKANDEITDESAAEARSTPASRTSRRSTRTTSTRVRSSRRR